LVAAVLVAASILFIGRYQISSVGYAVPGYNKEVVYRLDRWTGKVDVCAANQDTIECPAANPSAPR
jgi:hypothetical protein